MLSSPESGIQVNKASTQAHVRHDKSLDITNDVICTNPQVSHFQESSEISEKENQLQAAGQTHDNTQSPIVLETSDVPGLQLYILKDHMPQSVFELDIDQLISWIQRFQSASSQDYPVTRILECLQNYRAFSTTSTSINGTVQSIHLATWLTFMNIAGYLRHINLSFLTLSFQATQVQDSSPLESPDEELGR
jgi:hypothetical protein